MSTELKKNENVWRNRIVKTILWLCFTCLAAVTIMNGRFTLSTGVIEYADSVSLAGSWKMAAEQPAKGSAYTCRLPDDVTEGSALSLSNMPAGTKVYVDGKCIYSDTSKNIKNDVTHAYLWIGLPDGCSGDTVTVWSPKSGHDLLGELNYESSVGERAALQKELINESMYALVFSVMTLTFCFVIIYLQSKLKRGDIFRRTREMRALTEFLLCSSTWVLCDSQVFQCLVPRIGIVSMIGCVALLLLPMLFLRFVETIMPIKRMFLLNNISLGACV
ncbi:MAG: hypothetical protein ACI4LM_01180, partial [Anaerovoracaceae bacterium]